MTVKFFPATSVVASYLDDHAPLGFFRSVDHGHGTLDFLVADADGSRVAVILTGSDAGRIWQLNVGPASWAGTSFGPVELEVGDTFVSDYMRPMDVSVSSSGAFLRVNRGGQNYDLRVSDAADPGNSHEGFVFPNWRLVQRRDDGAPVVLFERMPPTSPP